MLTRYVIAADTADPTIIGVAPVTVRAAAAVGFAVLAPSSAAAGASFDVAAAEVDPYGNADPGYRGTAHFTTSDPDVVLPPDYAFQPGDAGRVTFPGGVTLWTPGDQPLGVTDVVNGLTVSAVVTVTAATGPPGPPDARPARTGGQGGTRGPDQGAIQARRAHRWDRGLGGGKRLPEGPGRARFPVAAAPWNAREEDAWLAFPPPSPCRCSLGTPARYEQLRTGARNPFEPRACAAHRLDELRHGMASWESAADRGMAERLANCLVVKVLAFRHERPPVAECPPFWAEWAGPPRFSPGRCRRAPGPSGPGSVPGRIAGDTESPTSAK